MDAAKGGPVQEMASKLEIREVVECWAVWRDAGDWDRFAEVWHSDGYMTATWFQGNYRDFIAVSRRAFDAGVRILHFLGGSAIDVRDDRAIAQTKMTISQRHAGCRDAEQVSLWLPPPWLPAGPAWLRCQDRAARPDRRSGRKAQLRRACLAGRIGHAWHPELTHRP